MVFRLEKNSKYHISISTIAEAEKQLGKKFYKFEIWFKSSKFYENFYTLLTCCEEFATDYWSGGCQNTIGDAGHFFYFYSKEDAVTFKLMAGAYFDYDCIISIKNHRKNPKPKTPKKHFNQNKQKILSHMHTRQLLKLRNKCYKLCSYYDDGKIVFYLDDIKEALGKRQHVMNKLEARRARQLAAKVKK